MEYRTLGRTGLNVSVMGIGAGGPSRLGQRDNINTEAESVDILLQGFDAGVNFVDTAEGYGTEEIVGKAIVQRDRSSLVISTKKSTRKEKFNPAGTVKSLEDSLRRLQTDYVDVYHIHGLRADDYDYCVHEIVPVLEKMRDQGKIRFIGVTEAYNSDLNHDMLQRALQDDIWDVLMVGFNFLNQNARDTVLVPAMKKNLGILIMFAVRRALSRPENLRKTVQMLIEQGEIDPVDIDSDRPLMDLIDKGYGMSIPDIAYRFCREEAGTHVILSGTSKPTHLQDNLASFDRELLSDIAIERLKHIFRNVKSVTGE